MGFYLAKTNFQSADDLLDKLDDLDMVEFKRNGYSHFALHITNGLCVHVHKEGFSSSSGGGSSRSSSGRSTNIADEFGYKSAQYLSTIAGEDKVRVNNEKEFVKSLHVTERPKEECIELALSGLPTDDNGDVIVGSPIRTKYCLVSKNCEVYATQWKYCFNSGVSSQVADASVGAVFGLLFLAGAIVLRLVTSRN